MTPRRLLLVPLLLLSALAAPTARAAAPAPARAKAAAPAGDVLPFAAVERTLPNGLKVVVVPTGFPDLVSLQIGIQTGSRNEVEPGKSGYAHFFEHMMFRGTKLWPPEKYQGVITRIGARQNAYTSDDLTNYHVTFSKEDLPEVLALEADRFMNLEYSREGFRTEARAILGEYTKNASNPIVKLDEAQREAAFRVHPYRHTTMGFLADIEAMPEGYDYSRLFYDRWYRPEHATLVIAGDVKPAEVLPLVERTFGKWKRGATTVAIPREPPPAGPVYTHVAWTTPTLPWVTVAFHGPAFSETDKGWAALDLQLELLFGQTSALYRKLVVEEQKVDALSTDDGPYVDPALFTVYARLKDPKDAVYVRDEILRAVAAARAAPPDAKALDAQRSYFRNAFARGLDSTDAIAATVASYTRFRRAYGTLNRLFRTQAGLTPADLQAAARAWFTDARLVVATLSREPLPAGIEKAPALASLEPRPSTPPITVLASKLPTVTVTLSFPAAGSAFDPKGKEGLAGLTAAMLADGGSRERTIDAIREALHPLAASVDAQVDKDMVTFTATFPRDRWRTFAEVALPQLTDPGFREDDFRRLKDERRNALVQDLRESNDEELAKERLQANVFAGTPYGHPAAGTVAGIDAITLDDVRAFAREHLGRAQLLVGVGGDVPPPFLVRLRAELGRLPAGATADLAARIPGRRPHGLEVEILEKDVRGVAISLGLPVDVLRGDPDFVALWVAKTWLGEHRSSSSHLYQRIREERGMNYGDYAYVEAFPRGMFQFFPDPNRARRGQLFELWIRPVQPQHAHMALRIALHELRSLVANGLTAEQFEATRQYLLKNVHLMVARQAQRVGYALDDRRFGTPEFTRYMREGLQKLTVADVNRAIRAHLSAEDLSVVMIAKDARGLAAALASDQISTVKYDAEKPAALLEEDRAIGAEKLGLTPERIRVTPIGEVFAR